MKACVQSIHTIHFTTLPALTTAILIPSCKSKNGNIAKEDLSLPKEDKEHLFLKVANATVATISIQPQGVQQCTLYIHNTPCTNYSYLCNKSHDTASRVGQSVKLG